jgi:GntR family transcriptional regulator
MPPPVSLTVAPTSGVPIYRQILEQIRAQIAGGRIPPGELLPSVRVVAEMLDVNPMTVSKAYSLLEREEIVELVRGQGMRVKPPGAAANGKARQLAILPLLREVADKARQLSLTRKQVLERLEPLLPEDDHDQ